MSKKKISQQTDALLQEAYEWVMVLEDVAVSHRDISEFEKWRRADPRHADLYDQAVTVKHAFSELRNEDFDPRIHQPSVGEVTRKCFETLQGLLSIRGLVYGGVTAIAAAAVAYFVLPIWIGQEVVHPTLEQPITLSAESAIGKIETVELSDGSIVTLAPASALTGSFTEGQRQIELETGAAYFQVAPDETRPFSVNAGLSTVTVLGTEFDVWQSAGTVRIAVSEGEVSIEHPYVMDGQVTSMISTQTLQAGEEIEATEARGLGRPALIDIERIAAWREGRLVYRGADIKQLLADANRYSELPIEIEGGDDAFEGLLVRGIFRGSDVDELLSTIAAIHPIEIDRSDEKRIVVRLRDGD